MLLRVACLTALIGALIAAPAQGQSCGTTHTVRAGETLSILAKKTLGSIEKFRLIHRANIDQLGSDPNNLEVGMRIYLPCEGKSVALGNEAPLMGVGDLAARSGRMQIVDLRSSEKLLGGVIPGALSAPYARWSVDGLPVGSPDYNRALSRLIGDIGLRLSEPIVLVAETGQPMDAGKAAYVYWVLKSSGARQVAILQGGQKAWFDAGQVLSPRTRGLFRFRANVALTDRWLAAPGEIDAIEQGSAPGALLDAVPHAHGSSGVVTADIAGLHKAMLMQSSGQDSIFTVLEWAKGLPVNWESELVISFCETKELAALSWFYISEVAGIRNVKLSPDAYGVGSSGEELALNKI